MIRKQTIKIKKYLDYLDPDHHDDQQEDNDEKELYIDHQEVTWKEP